MDYGLDMGEIWTRYEQDIWTIHSGPRRLSFGHSFHMLITSPNQKILTQTFQGEFLGVSHVESRCQGWPCPSGTWSGTLNVLQVWTSRTGGSWHTSNQAKELKFGTQVKNHISWESMMSRMTPTSKYPVRNPQHPPSMDFKDGEFLTHFYSC